MKIGHDAASRAYQITAKIPAYEFDHKLLGTFYYGKTSPYISTIRYSRIAGLIGLGLMFFDFDFVVIPLGVALIEIIVRITRSTNKYEKASDAYAAAQACVDELEAAELLTKEEE